MNLYSILSKSHKLPLLNKFLSRDVTSIQEVDLEAFKKSQDLAYKAAVEVSRLLAPGWSEKRAASMLDTYLRDSGVKNYFHNSFAWFADRTRFDGIKGYLDFMPTDRILQEGDAVILDTAPILDGYPADIGYSFCIGQNEKFKAAHSILKSYREQVRSLFEIPGITGVEIYRKVEEQFKLDGFDNCHKLYPLGVLGHRMYPVPFKKAPPLLKPFGWHAYWAVVSHGLFSETLGDYHSGDLDGLWAIEPHLGAEGFGLKFEELLWVRNGSAKWLGQGVFYEA